LCLRCSQNGVCMGGVGVKKSIYSLPKRRWWYPHALESKCGWREGLLLRDFTPLLKEYLTIWMKGFPNVHLFLLRTTSLHKESCLLGPILASWWGCRVCVQRYSNSAMNIFQSIYGMADLRNCINLIVGGFILCEVFHSCWFSCIKLHRVI
jgi:hypothetical protein